ncbi:MAG: DUF1631 family protein [Lautropia sp.]|nr:DUF1631 family protein [Lautropia sp.]
MPTSGVLIERSHIEILREIRQPILHALNRGFRSAFVKVVDQLVEQIVSETSWERQDLLNASLDLLRNHKAGIEKHFDQACARSWQERTGVGADGEQSTPITTIVNDEPPTLRLVDDDMVRDQLLVSRISARSRRRMEEESIDGLRARFGALLDQDWFAENEYPIAPDIILDLLRETLMEFQGFDSGGTTAFLLDMFEPKLSIELNELYQVVNRQLIAYGILPELRYSISKARNTALAALQEPDSQAEQGAADMLKGSTGAGRAPAAAAHLGSHVVSEDDLMQWAEQVGGQNDRVAMASATRYLADPHNFGLQGQVKAQSTSERLLNELSSLQTRVSDSDDPEAVSVLIAETHRRSTAAAQHHGSPLDRLIIETVAQVFQHVYEDDAIANAIKQQLLRLQVAAFKAALIDPSFFARPDHPMRRFVDRLAEIGSDPDFETEPGAPLVNDLESLVTWVLNNFERELVIIAEALDRTETIVAEENARRDERLAKIAEAAGKAERIDTIRQEVRRGLNQRMRSRVLPEAVGSFIMNSWVEVIVRLRDDTENLPFDEARAERVLDTLIWSVQPKKATEIKDLAKQLPQLIADLSRGMAFIAMPSAEREAFLRDLMVCHGKVIEQSKQRSLNGDDEPAMGSENADGVSDGGPATLVMRKPADPPSAAQTSSDDPGWDAVTRSGLQHGDEIERRSTDGGSKRYKLGWVSPAGTIFIFSRYPREHWTVRRHDLNAMLDSGEVSLVQNLSRVSTVIVALSNFEGEAATPQQG